MPRRLARLKESVEQCYGIKGNFRTVFVPILDLFEIPLVKTMAFKISYSTFSISTFFYILFSAKRRHTVIYSNESLPLLLLSFFFPNTFYEVHDFPRHSLLHRILLSLVKGVIVTNRSKKGELARQFGLADRKLFYEPNAVDVEGFAKAIGVTVRKKLNLSPGTVLVGYAGALKTMGMEKGIGLLLEAVASLPPRFRLLIVGGNTDDVSAYKAVSRTLHISDRVAFVGWVRHSEVSEYLAACDILVAPFPDTPHYRFLMSPLKIFEYMAAGKPIVASRLESITELLNDDSAYLVTPGDGKFLAQGIQTAASSPDARTKALHAKELVQNHSWNKRARRIIDFFGKY